MFDFIFPICCRRAARLGVIAAVAATAVGLAAPAAAEGSFSIRLDPRNAQEAQGIRLALALYGIHRDIESGAGVTQRGIDNLAQIGQSGTGNYGVIEQRGQDHRAGLDQRGNDNSYGIFQTGKGTDAFVSQSGNGQTGLLIVHGW